ncbi:MAG: ABC transporter permease [Candidatus Poribacteria bacterium]|nr:ABC transporter permease [Candidatus Poribacteria bacterium]
MEHNINLESEISTHPYEVRLSRPTEDTLLVQLSGNWTLGKGLPSSGEVEQALETGQRVQRVIFDTQGVTDWDTSLLPFLKKIMELCDHHAIQVEEDGLPQGVRRLLQLAMAVPAKDTGGVSKPAGFLARIGNATIGIAEPGAEMLSFIGDTFLVFLKLLRGRARFRRSDLTLLIYECGAQALPIVTLISFLIGVILAFVGAVQLKQFGAEIYVANLVGIAMTREMGPMMTAIVLAGRSGAAFAAQLGTMTVNEEVDAFKTMGFEPMEFLVLPRLLALTLMMPPLALYADFLGILGGAVVAKGLDVSFMQYFEQTRQALSPKHFALGLIKSAIYGVLVAIAGCLRGIKSGRSASAVGSAVTSAVVTGIVFIIVASAITTVIYEVIGV